MRYKDAVKIIDCGLNPGYVVSFEWLRNGCLHSDYFPDKDEDSIDTEYEAWDLARKFADMTRGRCVNINVRRRDTFLPASGDESKTIKNR